MSFSTLLISTECAAALLSFRYRSTNYANSDATFHLELIGNLVFKLNPGPLSPSIPTTVSRHESFRNNKGISRRNPRNLISVQPNRLLGGIDVIHGTAQTTFVRVVTPRQQTSVFIFKALRHCVY